VTGDILRRNMTTRLSTVSTGVGTAVSTKVAYDLLDDPSGPLLAAVTDRGVSALRFEADEREWVAEMEAAGVNVRRYPEALLVIRGQLGEYARGERRDFTVELDLGPLTGVKRRVLAETTKVPYGSVVTPREIAGAAGCSSGDALEALRTNPIAVMIPCHRVATDVYVGGAERRSQLLSLEAAWVRSTPSASPN
jgi:methylated-DNA-[protein]-cysteine S-methyltransferase